MAKRKYSKHTLNFRLGDIESLHDFCSDKNYNASDVVRRLVANFVDKINSTSTSEEELTQIKGVDL